MRERYINGIANTKHYRRECRHCKATFAHWYRSMKKADEVWNRRFDAMPVVRGEWIENPTKDSVLCSYCYADWDLFDNDTYRFCYCPNCGAKMEVEP